MATVSGKSSVAVDDFSLSDMLVYISYTGTPNTTGRYIDLEFHVWMTSRSDATGMTTNMAWQVTKGSKNTTSGIFTLKAGGEVIASQADYQLYCHWDVNKTKLEYHKVDNFGTSVKKRFYYKDDGSLKFSLYFDLQKDGVWGVYVGKAQNIRLRIDETITLPSIGANWTAPSTSDFWVSRSPASVKPDGTITCSCGGLSGGSGNGDYKDYRMYFTVYRGGDKIGTHDLGVTSNTSFVPSSYYHPRVGDSIFVHGVGRTKNSSGDIYDLIDKCYQENSTNTSTRIYKDGIVYIKDTSGVQHEATMAYVKDTSGNKQKLRYIPVKDTSGVQRIIDMYTVYYES